MGLTPASPGGHCSPPGWATSRATARCSSSRSRIAAPRAPTTSGSSFWATPCSTCCSPNACTANFPTASEGDLSRLRARLVSEEPLAGDRAGHAARRIAVAGVGRAQDRRFPPPVDPRGCLRSLVRRAVSRWRARRGACPRSAPCSRRASRRCPSPSTLKDAKTRLQEHLQANGRPLPVYAVKRTSGEPHAQMFLVSCAVPHAGVETEGEGPSRRRAEQVAAQAALEALGQHV